jgi:hypothetical protein
MIEIDLEKEKQSIAQEYKEYFELSNLINFE